MGHSLDLRVLSPKVSGQTHTWGLLSRLGNLKRSSSVPCICLMPCSVYPWFFDVQSLHRLLRNPEVLAFGRAQLAHPVLLWQNSSWAA